MRCRGDPPSRLCKVADRVVVLESGEIVDIGTHDELLSRPGKYADMWTAQAQWYEREEKQEIQL